MRKFQKQHTSVIIGKSQAKEIEPIKIQDMESYQHCMDIQDSMIGMETQPDQY